MSTGYKKLGKYDVLDVIGRGGMGVIYKGIDPGIGRTVAIKMITGGLVGSPELLQRFYREAQSAGKLQHPNIVTIHDLGVQDGNPYLVLEFLEGESLETAIKSRRPIPLEDKLEIVIQVCNGLGYAHKRHIVHRDIKPANIMLLKDGGVKIVDFGIARIGDQGITRQDEILGSIPYMSPEQVDGRRVDARSDIFSLGILLYQLLTSTLPFEGKDAGEVLLKIIHQAAPPLSQHLACYPAELDEIVQRALAKDPEQRYQTAEDLAFDLAHVQEQVKRQRVTEYLRTAEVARAQQQLSRAKEQLLEVLKIERQNTRANALLREVLQEIQNQQRCEQARELHSEAEAALARGEQSEALAFLDKAVQLDKDNAEIVQLCASVREKKARSDKLRELLRRAEMAHDAADLDEARHVIEEALLVDEACPEVQSSHAAICREIAQRDQQLQVQKFMNEARQQLSRRHFTAALKILRGAQSIAPSVSGLQELINLAESGQQQERRRKDLELLTSEIENALNRDDYTTACAKAEEGLRNYPDDRGLSKLKAVADKQRETSERRDYIEVTISAARRLLDERKTQEALHALQEALEKYPAEFALQSMYSLVMKDIERVQAEQKKAEVVQKAKEAIYRKNYEEAVAILEIARQEAESNDLDDLLQFAQDEAANLAKRQTIDAVSEEAHRLNSEEKYEEAIDLLEKTLREVPDQELEIILSDIRCHVEELNNQVQEAISSARRLLRQERFADAVKFLESKGLRYVKWPEFSALLEEARRGNQFMQAFSVTKEKVREAISRAELDRAQEIWERSREQLGDAEEFRMLGAEIEAKRTEKANAALEMALRDARVLLLVRSFDSAVSVLETVASQAPNADPELRAKFDGLFDEARAGALGQRQRKEALARQVGSDSTETQEASAEAGPTVSLHLDDETVVADPAQLQEILGKVTVIADHYREDENVQSAIGSLKEDLTWRISMLLEAGLADRELQSAAEKTLHPRETTPVEQERVPAASALQVAPAASKPAAPSIVKHPPPFESTSPAVTVAGTGEAITGVAPSERAVVPTAVQRPPGTQEEVVRGPVSAFWKRPPVLIGAAAVVLVVIGVAVYVGQHPHSAPPAQAPVRPAAPATDPIEARQEVALDEVHKRMARADLEGAQQILKEVASLNGPRTTEIRALLEKVATLRLLWPRAIQETDDAKFEAAKKDFRQILALEEDTQRKQEAQHYLDQVIPSREREEWLFAQAQQESPKLSLSNLQHALDLLGRVIALNGPRKSAAEDLRIKVTSKLADLKKRCEHLKESLQLGDVPSGEESTFFKEGCH